MDLPKLYGGRRRRTSMELGRIACAAFAAAVLASGEAYGAADAVSFDAGPGKTGFEAVADNAAAPPVPAAGPAEHVRHVERLKSTGPSDCYNGVYQFIPKLLTVQLAVKLCAGAKSDAPARCLKTMPGPEALAADISVETCGGAESAAPAECFMNIYGDETWNGMPRELTAKLCRLAEDLTPARCIRELPAGTPWDAAVELCRTREGDASKASLPRSRPASW